MVMDTDELRKLLEAATSGHRDFCPIGLVHINGVMLPKPVDETRLDGETWIEMRRRVAHKIGARDQTREANSTLDTMAYELATEVLALRAKVAAGEKLAEAVGHIMRTMRGMLEANDAIRNLSALGRASLTGELLTAEAAAAAYEALQSEAATGGLGWEMKGE